MIVGFNPASSARTTWAFHSYCCVHTWFTTSCHKLTLWLPWEVHALEEGLEAGVGAEGVEGKQCAEMCHQAVALRR